MNEGHEVKSNDRKKPASTEKPSAGKESAMRKVEEKRKPRTERSSEPLSHGQRK